jgi:hypothetical protein
VGRKVSRPGETGDQKGEPATPPPAGRTARSTCRIGPDGFYGSSDWGDEIDWGRLTGRSPRPLVKRKRRSGGDAPDCVVDPERVGALLDGELTGPDREAALGEIAASDDDACVFADTAAVLRETEEEPPPAP